LTKWSYVVGLKKHVSFILCVCRTLVDGAVVAVVGFNESRVLRFLIFDPFQICRKVMSVAGAVIFSIAQCNLRVILRFLFPFPTNYSPDKFIVFVEVPVGVQRLIQTI